MDINDLRRARAAAAELMGAQAAALTALENAETLDGPAIDAADAAFKTAQTSFDRLDAQVKRAETAEAARAASAVPAPISPPGVSRPARAANPADQGVAAGLFVLSLSASNGDPDRAAHYAEQRLGASAVAEELRAALNTFSDPAGGVIVPEVYSSEIIKLLSGRAVVRRAGARVIDMPAGNIRDAVQTGAASATYEAETAPIQASEPTFDQASKKFKKLTGMVPISNDLIRQGSPSAASFVRDDLVNSMVLREDMAFLRDDGTANTPKGLRYWAKAAHIFGAAATTNAITVTQDLRKMVNLVEEANIPLTRAGWIMRPSIRNYLAELRNATTGVKIFPEIDASNELHGFPIHRTTQVPGNLGGGTDSEIYFADFNEIVIGDSLQLSIATTTEAGYVDGDGDFISAFQRDLTLMRAISEHDLAPRYDEAISILTGVDWHLAA